MKVICIRAESVHQYCVIGRCAHLHTATSPFFIFFCNLRLGLKFICINLIKKWGVVTQCWYTQNFEIEMKDYNKIDFLVINSHISEKWCSSGLEMIQI